MDQKEEQTEEIFTDEMAKAIYIWPDEAYVYTTKGNNFVVNVNRRRVESNHPTQDQIIASIRRNCYN